MIKVLEKEFIGSGEVAGIGFAQIRFSTSAYLYKRYQSGTQVSFEVFKRKNTAMCIDFENRVYSESDFKEIYPKAKDFGIWAWAYKSKEKAIKKFNEL